MRYKVKYILGALAAAMAVSGCIYSEENCEPDTPSTVSRASYLSVSLDMSRYFKGEPTIASDGTRAESFGFGQVTYSAEDGGTEDNTTPENTVNRIDVLLFGSDSVLVKHFSFVSDDSFASDSTGIVGSFTAGTDGSLQCSPKKVPAGTYKLCVSVNAQLEGLENGTSEYPSCLGTAMAIPRRACDSDGSFLLKYYCEKDDVTVSSTEETPVSGLVPVRTCAKLRVHFTNASNGELYSGTDNWRLAVMGIGNFMENNYLIPGMHAAATQSNGTFLFPLYRAFNSTDNLSDLANIMGLTAEAEASAVAAEIPADTAYYMGKFDALSTLEGLMDTASTASVVNDTIFNCYISDYNLDYTAPSYSEPSISTTTDGVSYTSNPTAPFLFLGFDHDMTGEGTRSDNVSLDGVMRYYIPFMNHSSVTASYIYDSSSYSYNEYTLVRGYIYEIDITYKGEKNIDFSLSVQPWDEEERPIEVY